MKSINQDFIIPPSYRIAIGLKYTLYQSTGEKANMPIDFPVNEVFYNGY